MEQTPFRIVTKNESWQRLIDHNGQEIPRRAGVSSFGFGGVNSHILLEEYMDRQKSNSKFDASNVFVLSAKNQEALLEYTNKFIDFFQSFYHDNDDINVDTITLFEEIAGIVTEILGISLADISPEEELLDYLDDPVLIREFMLRFNKKYHTDFNFFKDGEKYHYRKYAKIYRLSNLFHRKKTRKKYPLKKLFIHCRPGAKKWHSVWRLYRQ